MADSKGAGKSGNDGGTQSSHESESEQLLGLLRAAVTEVTASQQAAAKSAKDAELDRTKAAEHLFEIEAKLTTAGDNSEKISQFAESAATASSAILGVFSIIFLRLIHLTPP